MKIVKKEKIALPLSYFQYYDDDDCDHGGEGKVGDGWLGFRLLSETFHSLFLAFGCLLDHDIGRNLRLRHLNLVFCPFHFFLPTFITVYESSYEAALIAHIYTLSAGIIIVVICSSSYSSFLFTSIWSSLFTWFIGCSL